MWPIHACRGTEKGFSPLVGTRMASRRDQSPNGPSCAVRLSWFRLLTRCKSCFGCAWRIGLGQVNEEALKQAFELWKPKEDKKATGDAYKTLFIGKISYDTTEKKVPFLFIREVCDK